uniref:EF-hand domain-containing protein n=1 Tax=Guillardia theta TaxID=55529 RepID=A0A7S4NJR6_GUITH|mmetsp:Transcript_24055/g.78252  ORF Transcript_24055/g.78252 Transcript_24055/m.78252 type:complete len:386 (+) Transcript_24055:929-2086(+)
MPTRYRCEDSVIAMIDQTKVLRFYAQWDDRSSMFGQKLEYIINYFLQDDKIEVLEVKQQNSGRDPFPKLVKKQRVPRVFRGVPSVGSKEEDFEDEYISDKDLIVGNTIEIFGRDMFLYDCDSFTREYYLHQYGVEQPANQVEPETHVEFPSMPLPPYNGFGSEHDSLASYFNLIPKPRKYDRTKQAALDSIIFRWKAKFDIEKMSMVNPDDHKRRFVISYFMGDGSLSIYEPPIQNSGFVGGKFLERQRVIRHKAKFGDWMTEQDLLIELPGTVWINNYPFSLLETDKFTLRYIHKGKLDNIVSIDLIHQKMRNKVQGMSREIMNVFRLIDEEQSGAVSLDDLVNVIRKFNFELDEDEIIALMGRWDQQKNGFIFYEDFVRTIFE